MNRSNDDLVAAILELYGRIGALLNWRAINELKETDQVTAMLDARERLIREVGECTLELERRLGPDGLRVHPDYQALLTARNEAVGMDDSIVEKIKSKMADIQNELRTKALFKSHALPCYLKQKMAFSR